MIFLFVSCFYCNTCKYSVGHVSARVWAGIRFLPTQFSFFFLLFCCAIMEGAEETLLPKKSDDGVIALVILVIAIVLAAVIGIYFWKNNKGNSKSRFVLYWLFSILLTVVFVSFQSGGGFSVPPERETYIEAKSSMDLSNPSNIDELKKLLMKRALKTIPIVLSLQNEGSSIERLYKKGMLTDDMHFKVKELKSFVDTEFQDVQSEAEELVEGWGQMIWPQAMQFHQVFLLSYLDSFLLVCYFSSTDDTKAIWG
jgi:hypothetical protein